jgi:hypothetical protein
MPDPHSESRNLRFEPLCDRERVYFRTSTLLRILRSTGLGRVTISENADFAGPSNETISLCIGSGICWSRRVILFRLEQRWPRVGSVA